ncbi:MAG: uL15m family ribosomal protein [Candidatus Diapherotrites archaeon]
MTVRKRKKKLRLRGGRTFGQGNTKNRRGSGSRGGCGRAGSHKHKFSKYYDSFGTKIRMKPKEREKAVNLDELNELIPGLLAEKKIIGEEKKIIIDAKNVLFSKILGRGKTEFVLELKGIKASRKAKQKIESKGGKIE